MVLGDPESLGRCDTESRGQEDLAIIRIPQVRKRRPVCIPGPGSERGLGLEIDAAPLPLPTPAWGHEQDPSAHRNLLQSSLEEFLFLT